MSLQIDSRVFEVKDQNSLQQLMSFLSLDIQLDGQRYVFKDDQQFAKFQKFRSSFDTIKSIFPNFQMKIKPKLDSSNQNFNPSSKKDKDETYQKNLSTQINSDQSLTNNKGDQSYQKCCETPTEQGDVQFEQIQQKIQQVDPKTAEAADSQNFDNESSIISEVENSQDYSMHEFSERISQIIDQSMNIFDDKIKIKHNDTTFTIQLKNNQILQIIEQLYLDKWSKLIHKVNLIKQSMNCYKLQQNTDQFYINQEIQSFIDSIQSVEIQFCFYSCYTMKEQQSMMNRYLSQRQVQIAQIGDEFYLVSREQSQQFLQKIIQKIYENYRGYMFYFSSSKPYPNFISNNPILEKSRYLFYKKYLSQDVQQYSFNQYFNENFYFIEMNFSLIQERRELVEKYTKEYIGGFIKNLFLLKFSIQTSQDIGLKVEKAFQDYIEELKLKILFYKNNGDLILFGINEDILKLLLHLEAMEFKYQFKKFDVEIDKQNYLFKLKGVQQKIDLKSVKTNLKQFGYQQVDKKKLQFSTVLDRNQNFQNLISILKYLCIIREQNNNRRALQILHQKFRIAIEKKDLQNEIQFLKQINTINIEQLQLQQQQQQQQQQQVISLNIRAELQQFPISQTITLDPVFLDEIIQENLYQEFLDKLVSNNQKIQFQKISQGNYQLQCINDQVVTQFKQYFNKFQNIRLQLDKTSLSCFELSHYLKKELKKRCIYWKVVGPEELYLITRNNESLKYAQDFKYYKGRIISMLSLKETNLNEKVEYHQLVLARTNYFRYKIYDFLKQNLTQIKEIEFREEQEISAFCIIHSNFSNYEQQIDKCIEQIQCLIGSKTFLELKTKPEFGKKILEKILEISDLYVSQKQEYQDYYITMLGSKKNFQKIDQLFQKLQLPNDLVLNIQISFYIEQFIPYKNIVQKTQNRDKFKRSLESKGFFVDDTNIKWIIETKQELSKSNFFIFMYLAMIFTNLTEWMNQDQMQNIRNNYLLNLEMMEQSEIQINVSQNNFLEIENSLLNFLEKDNNQINKLDNRNLQILQESGYTENQGFLDNCILTQELSERRSISEISDQDSHINLSSIGNQEYDLLAQFPKGAQQKELPADSQLAQVLRANYSNQNFLAFQPYVDQNYKEYFYKLTSEFVDLYVVQKSDKVYKGKFSKSMLYLVKAKSAIEKLMENTQFILIVFKTNKLCKFSNYKDKDKIILKEDNQVIPYLFLQRK